MATRKKLINLHGINDGKNVVIGKGLELGEIAVRNAGNAVDAELYVANSGKTAAAVFATKDAITSAYTSAIATAKSDITTAYEAADLALGGRIDNEVTARTEAVKGVADDLAAEISARTEAISGLTTSLNTTKETLQGGIDDLNDALTAETQARETAVSGLTDDLAQEIQDREAAVQGVADDLAQEIQDREAAVKGVADALAAEVSARTEAVEELQGAIESAQAAATTKVIEGTDNGHLSIEETKAEDGSTTYTITVTDVASEETLSEVKDDLEEVTGKVTTLIGSDANKSVRTIANEELAAMLISGAENGAEDNFTTLKELADWLEKHPEDAAAMNSAISDLEGIVGAGVEGTTLTAEISRVEGEYKDAVAAEVSARTEAVQGVADDLAQEVQDREAAVKGVADDLADETSARTSEDSRLNDAITAETKARQDAITEINKTINGEGEATGLAGRIAALESGLADETSARTSEDSRLNDAITAETQARTTAVSGLADRIKAIEDATVGAAATAVQDVTVKNTTENGITATKGEGNVIELNFDAMVINCGRYDE